MARIIIVLVLIFMAVAAWFLIEWVGESKFYKRERKKETTQEMLEKCDIEEIERFLRKKKLEKFKKENFWNKKLF